MKINHFIKNQFVNSLKFLKNKNILITGGTGTVGLPVFKLIQSRCKLSE